MTDKQRQIIIKKVLKLNEFYKAGKIPTLEIHEIHPDLEKGSRENYLYFTLAPCLNFQRSSPALWQSAHSTFMDRETNYLFDPTNIVRQDRSRIQADLIKHKLALQPNKHTDIWIKISTTLHYFYNSDPRLLFEQSGWDVVKILQTLQIDKRKDFPYLSGPKLSNYWLFILSKFTDANFKNTEYISIIPDTHVLQSTVKLGLSDKIVTPIIAEALWRELLKGSGVNPVELHPVLWNWSRNGFLPGVE